jgi:ABC-type nitrate/sulfonate/bicarbonate transport system substrate-binding protein
MTSRRLCKITGGALLGLVMLGFSGPATAEKVKMTIGYQSLWATVGELYETLRHTNILELNGIEADFATFTYGGPLGEGYVAGKIDTVIGADAPVLRGLARKPGKVLHRTHDWRWGVVALPKHDGKSLGDLRGLKLGGPFGTTVFPRTVRKLVQAGIKEPFKEITIINLDVAEQVPSLQSAAVDAIVTWDPVMEKLRRSKIGVPIYLSKPGEGQGWQGISQEFIDTYGEDGVVRFLKSWIMAYWWVSNNKTEAMEWFAETSRLPADLLDVSMNNDRWLKASIEDIKIIDLTISERDVRDAQAVMDFQVEHKLMDKKVDVASLVDMSYLTRAQKEIADGDHPPLSSIKSMK